MFIIMHPKWQVYPQIMVSSVDTLVPGPNLSVNTSCWGTAQLHSPMKMDQTTLSRAFRVHFCDYINCDILTSPPCTCIPKKSWADFAYFSLPLGTSGWEIYHSQFKSQGLTRGPQSHGISSQTIHPMAENGAILTLGVLSPRFIHQWICLHSHP